MEELNKEEISELRRIASQVRISPSKRVIYGMSDDELLKHHALIMHKASSFSSTQRKLIQTRIAHGIEKKRFTMERVVEEVNHLTRIVNKYIEDNA